jgi:hypothetical protein
LQTYTTPTGNGPTTGADQGATDQAKDKASQAAGAAKEQAQQAAGQAKGALRSQVDQRSTQAGEKVGGFASDVRTVSQQLREQGKDQPAKIADQAAERADRLGSYLKHNDADRILGDIEDFGRRQPWAVIAGGVLAGLAASRFLKASSTRRYEQQRSQSYRQLPVRTTPGIHTQPVGTGPAVPTTPPVVPTTPPADTTLTGGMPAGSPGATAPGPSRFEGR